MTPEPPLPEPGFQSPEDRRVISRRFIRHAREELERGNRLQAGEKAWGAVAQHLKIIGELRGWNHESHRQLESIGRHILAEFSAPSEIAVAVSNAYNIGHKNFYENQWGADKIAETIEEVEDALPFLESAQTEAPRPFTIEFQRQRRRLIELTGNRELRVGDTSPAGFSLRHPPDYTSGDGV